ncbi:hypothetical protein V2I01_22240 [Micromonospora sp. BRA006-A]|nr:hypothetical protein [Micromonospora sp. BRA006-A]
MSRNPLRAALTALAALLPVLALGLALTATTPPAAAALPRSASCRSATPSPGRPAAGGRCSGTASSPPATPTSTSSARSRPQGCGVPYDGDNRGHGGYLATNVANQNLLPGWLAATRPDVVLMHFGTNDV